MAARTIDLCIGTGSAREEPFVTILKDCCRLRRLHCIVCNDANVNRIMNAVENGRTRIRAHLDLFGYAASTDTPYTRLSYAVLDNGGFVVNEPKNASAAENKALMHEAFRAAGLDVPFTVVVRNWKPKRFRLSRAQRKRLGHPFIIKPARGYGRQGVVKVAHGTFREIAGARRFDPGDDFLLQEFVEPVWYAEKMGWFRVFHVLGQVVICWWDTQTEHYRCVSLDEYHTHRLAPLGVLLPRIAHICGLRYFSTEIAAVKKNTRTAFVAIDYVNDPCDMTPQSLSHSGVPDVLVRHVAERIAECALDLSRTDKTRSQDGLWFAE